MTDLTTRIAALEELDKKRTQGSWIIEPGKYGDNWPIAHGFGRDNDRTEPVLVLDNIRASEVVSGSATDDARFCAAAPEMMAVIRELVKENEKLKEYKWMYEDLCK